MLFLNLLIFLFGSITSIVEASTTNSELGNCYSELTTYSDDIVDIDVSQNGGNTWQNIANGNVWYISVNVKDIITNINTVIKFTTQNRLGPGDFVATIKIHGPTGQSEEIYTDEHFTYIKMDSNTARQYGDVFQLHQFGSPNYRAKIDINNNNLLINDKAYWRTWYGYIGVNMIWVLDFYNAKHIINKICYNEWNDDRHLFVIPNQKRNFNQAQQYCQTDYSGNVANIYDPDENRHIQQLVNRNYLEKVFIGYYKKESKWKWDSEWNGKTQNMSSNPMLWLESPLINAASNVEEPDTKCIFMTRFGWQYGSCDEISFFVCERHDHFPKFNESYPFMLSNRKLSFNNARSLCRALFKAD
eukprot:159699_1